ncbi:hypothetical protein [Variovorax sp. W2I14]|uniref:hypothetical protein n=1 Tax=Variovorax sp. W2I14 TaxID=3042290 RepID=UPI003D22C37B
MNPLIFVNAPIPASSRKISLADIQFLTDYDPMSYDHWLFNKGSSLDLTGRKQGKALTPQSGAPSYSPNYLTIANALGNGLLTDLSETATAVDTMCVVVRDNATNGLQSILGSLGTAGDNSGGGVFFSGSGAARTLFASYRGTTINSAGLGAPTPAGSHYFVGVSRDFSGGVKRVNMFVGGVASIALTGSNAFAPAPAPRKLGIGSTYIVSAGTPSTSVDFAEAAFYTDVFRSLADLEAMYQKAKVRQAALGIAVV